MRRTVNNGDSRGGLARLLGLTSPRHERVLWELLKLAEPATLSRESVDRCAGASNGPELIRQLRRMFGIRIPCERALIRDRDGRTSRPGFYSLTSDDRAKLWELIRRNSG